MKDLGCARAARGSRHAHDFQPFAADLSGEARTVAAIYCRLCGVVRRVEVEPDVRPLDDGVADYSAFSRRGTETR